jgi:hypothetical protein
MDWWIDCIHHPELQAITALSLNCTLYSSPLHTHLCPQSVTLSTSRFLVTDFNTRTITVSPKHTPDITALRCASLRSPTANWTELHSIIVMPQFLISIPLLPSSYPDRLASRNSTVSLPFLLNHLRVPSQETPSILLSVKVKVKVTLRLAIYRQSVRLDVKPLEILVI